MSLADSSISPTMIIGRAPSRCRASYSSVPAATVPMIPPSTATSASRLVGTITCRPLEAAKTSTEAGTTMEPSKINDGMKLRFWVSTRVLSTSR